MEEQQTTEKLIEAYFPSLTDEPFVDEKEQLLAWQRFVDLTVAISFVQIDFVPEESKSRVGAYMSDLDAEDIYAPGGAAVFDGQQAMREVFETLLDKGEDEDGVALFPLSYLLGSLTDVEKWLFVLAYIGSTGRKYERFFKLLQEGGKEIAAPTLGLACDLSRFFFTEKEREDMVSESERSFSGRYFFTEDEDTGLRRQLVLSPTVLTYLKNDDGDVSETGGASDSVTELLPISESSYIAQEDAYSILSHTLQNCIGNPVLSEPILIELVGETGSGRRFLIERAAEQIGFRVLSVDGGRILMFDTEERRDICRDIVLKCLLFRYIPYIHRLPERDNDAVASFLSDLTGRMFVTCVGMTSMMAPSVRRAISAHIRKIELAYPGAEVQQRLWEDMAEQLGLHFPEDYPMTELVSKYKMNPGRIADALYLTAMRTPADDDYGMIRLDVLEEEIRSLSATDFGDNATRLRSPFTWDDLEVSEYSRKLLTLSCNRVKYSAMVNSGFGFGRKLPYGRGVAIVLYGPPGTGKTMAAQVIAAELNLDIFRVDLSQISSKYIGETEKNLASIFDAAKNSNAILFFDEADSLFSKRTEVTTSNDKYANAETSYLLQKIEEYDGVSVLATNNMQNFDVAFKRRMTYLIPIEAPDENTRKALWEKVFPPETPVSEMVDFSFFARELEITGAQIKSIAVASAYLAAANGRSVTPEDIIDAADIECAKVGRLNVGSSLRAAALAGI